MQYLNFSLSLYTLSNAPLSSPGSWAKNLSSSVKSAKKSGAVSVFSIKVSSHSFWHRPNKLIFGRDFEGAGEPGLHRSRVSDMAGLKGSGAENNGGRVEIGEGVTEVKGMFWLYRFLETIRLLNRITFCTSLMRYVEQSGSFTCQKP